MAKCRWIYGGTVLLTFLLAFFFGYRYLTGIFLMELCLPVLLFCLLYLDAGGIRLSFRVRRSCACGQDPHLAVLVRRNRRLTAAGILCVRLEFQNVLLGESRINRVQIPLSGRVQAVDIPYQLRVCGEIHVTCREAYVCDLFGLCRRPVRCPVPTAFTSNPGNALVTLAAMKIPCSAAEGEYDSRRRRGNDASEVFDLKEYENGDDVRSVHWKLSSKLGKLIVREPSDTSHFDTALLVDAGLGRDGHAWNEQAVSGAVELSATLSEKLLELGIPHYVIVPVHGRLHTMQADNRGSYERMVEQWMGIPVPEQGGEGLRAFAAERLWSRFSRLIYVTAGAFPDLLYHLSDETDLTALCVTEEGEGVRMAEGGLRRFLELPAGLLKTSETRILI